MPSKIETYTALAAQTAAKITADFTSWTAFLSFAARLYKYNFREQLMIYAQRPQATACAEYSIWTQKMRRYVKRAAKGIAVVREVEGVPTLRYVFDLADTGPMDDGLHLYFWTAHDEFGPVVAAALEPDQLFDSEDFAHVYECDTQESVQALGDAFSQCSEMVLRTIEHNIKQCLRDKQAGQDIRPASPSPEPGEPAAA